jgi:tRNA(Leu) C34 or U34 (ribose-2'-O)-methylase TrmL
VRGFAAIGLVRPKDRSNLGSVLRAAACYDASLVAFQAPRYGDGDLRRAITDTTKAWRHIPTLNGDDIMDLMPVGSVPVAVDLVPGAVSLCDFKHPQSAFYIFGPEDGTLGASVTDRCAHKVMIPTAYCMNLAATVNVVLYDRLAKRNADVAQRKEHPASNRRVAGSIPAVCANLTEAA